MNTHVWKTVNEEMVGIDELVRLHYDAVYHLALSILEDDDLASDAAQETFIIANRKLASFRGASQVRTWLFAIGANVCRSKLRRRNARQRMRTAFGRTAPERPPLPEAAAVQADEARAVRQAVRQLPDKMRLPVILFYVHNLPTEQIATILDIRVGTVHSRLFHARKRLHGLLSGMEVQP